MCSCITHFESISPETAFTTGGLGPDISSESGPARALHVVTSFIT